MTVVELDIPGKPTGKGRPRFAGHTYTPSKTRDYEKKIKQAYLDKYGPRMAFPDGAVMVEVTAFFKIPEGKRKAVKASMKRGDTVPVITPDIDNILKAVMDGLNGMAYKDDRQVATVVALKVYDSIGHVRARVTRV